MKHVLAVDGGNSKTLAVVADGDGVVIVPRAAAKDVAVHARGILDGDKAGRKALYKSMGLPLDKTVE